MGTVLTLGLLRESYPDLAERRPRNTDWVIESLSDLVAIARSLTRAE